MAEKKKPEEVVKVTVCLDENRKIVKFVYADWLGRSMEVAAKDWATFPLSLILEGLRSIRLQRALEKNPKLSYEDIRHNIRIPTVVYCFS
jgi:hypothetical protein